MPQIDGWRNSLESRSGASRGSSITCRCQPEGWHKVGMSLPDKALTSTSKSACRVKRYKKWWFGTFFIFPYIGNNNLN